VLLENPLQEGKKKGNGVNQNHRENANFLYVIREVGIKPSS